MAYIYLLQDGEDKGTSIYKIGRTVQKGGDSRKLSRLQAYNKGTVVYNTWIVDEGHVNHIEKTIKDTFAKEYRLVRGTEWFEGDVKVMKKKIDAIIEQLDLAMRMDSITESLVEKMNLSDEDEKLRCQYNLHLALLYAMENGEYDPEKPGSLNTALKWINTITEREMKNEEHDPEKPEESLDDDSDDPDEYDNLFFHADEKEPVNNKDRFNTVEEVLRSENVTHEDKARIIQCLKKVILHCKFNDQGPEWGNCDIHFNNTSTHADLYKVHPDRTLTLIKHYDPLDFHHLRFKFSD